MDDIGRKHPAHGVRISLAQPTIVFLTACTKDRRPWLACEEAHRALVGAWNSAQAWQVGRYILMPDHVHLFCAPTDLEILLENWVRFWKSQFSKTTSHPDWRWQPHHWDTRLRRGENYHAKWNYVRENPVRVGLARDADGWPFQGEQNVLPW